MKSSTKRKTIQKKAKVVSKREKKVKAILSNLCIDCKGSGRGPLAGLAETSCNECSGTGKL